MSAQLKGVQLHINGKPIGTLVEITQLQNAIRECRQEITALLKQSTTVYVVLLGKIDYTLNSKGKRALVAAKQDASKLNKSHLDSGLVRLWTAIEELGFTPGLAQGFSKNNIAGLQLCILPKM